MTEQDCQTTYEQECEEVEEEEDEEECTETFDQVSVNFGCNQ